MKSLLTLILHLPTPWAPVTWECAVMGNPSLGGPRQAGPLAAGWRQEDGGKEHTEGRANRPGQGAASRKGWHQVCILNDGEPVHISMAGVSRSRFSGLLNPGLHLAFRSHRMVEEVQEWKLSSDLQGNNSRRHLALSTPRQLVRVSVWSHEHAEHTSAFLH